MPKHHVFVYGTLKDGLSNHRLLKAAEFIGRGCTVQPYVMRDTGGFPVVFQEEQKANVRGEIYEVDDHILGHLDSLEGHPQFFERREITVDIEDTGVQQTCWMYFGNQKGGYWGQRNLPEATVHSGAYNWRA